MTDSFWIGTDRIPSALPAHQDKHPDLVVSDGGVSAPSSATQYEVEASTISGEFMPPGDAVYFSGTPVTVERISSEGKLCTSPIFVIEGKLAKIYQGVRIGGSIVVPDEKGGLKSVSTVIRDITFAKDHVRDRKRAVVLTASGAIYWIETL